MSEPGEMDSDSVDIGNWQMVGKNGAGEITVLLPKNAMTREEALVHAAWIVALADDFRPDAGLFPDLLRRVLHT